MRYNATQARSLWAITKIEKKGNVKFDDGLAACKGVGHSGAIFSQPILTNQSAKRSGCEFSVTHIKIPEKRPKNAQKMGQCRYYPHKTRKARSGFTFLCDQRTILVHDLTASEITLDGVPVLARCHSRAADQLDRSVAAESQHS